MYKQILVALKFSLASRQALEHAAGLARETGAVLHVFHALDYRLKALDPDDPKCALSCTEARERFEREIAPMLDGIEYEFDCRPADAAMEISRLARSLPADLIVLGCHQRAGMGLGRVSYTGITIMEKAPCPVMLIPYKE